MGELNERRYGHSVIQVDNEFIVVGGRKDMYDTKFHTESCKLTDQTMTCTNREPKLNNFNNYPELMLIL